MPLHVTTPIGNDRTFPVFVGLEEGQTIVSLDVSHARPTGGDPLTYALGSPRIVAVEDTPGAYEVTLFFDVEGRNVVTVVVVVSGSPQLRATQQAIVDVEPLAVPATS